jgi:hypothetical protein
MYESNMAVLTNKRRFQDGKQKQNTSKDTKNEGKHGLREKSIKK